MAPKWAPNWFQSDEDKDGKKDEKGKLPPELEERFKSVDETKTAVSAIQEKLKGLDSIVAFFDDQKKEKEEAARKAAEKTKKDNEPSDEDLAARLLSDPKGAIDDITKDQRAFMLTINAENVRRKVFEDNASDYEYYSGDIKKEVDALIAGQDLKFQNNPASLANAYHTVVGKRMKEISEGKIKSRFASTSSSTISDKSKKNEDFEIDITPDMIKAARNSGMDIADFTKLVKKAALAGELEVV